MGDSEQFNTPRQFPSGWQNPLQAEFKFRLHNLVLRDNPLPGDKILFKRSSNFGSIKLFIFIYSIPQNIQVTAVGNNNLYPFSTWQDYQTGGTSRYMPD